MPGTGIFVSLCLLGEILLPKWCNFIKLFYMYTHISRIHIIFTFKLFLINYACMFTLRHRHTQTGIELGTSGAAGGMLKL